MKAAENKWSRAGEWYAAGLLLVYACVILLHAGAPSLTDYANWTYQGVLLRDHLLGRPDAAHLLKNYPVPNSAATLGIGVLALVLPWLMAAKVYLCGQLLVSYLALRHLLKTVGGGMVAWVVGTQALFLNVNFWYGFSNFQLGLSWVMLTASLLLRQVRHPGDRNWQLGVLLLIAFFTHMIPFCFCGLLLLMYAVQTKRRLVLWQVVPAGLVSTWYVAGRYLVAGNADGQTGMVPSVKDYSAIFWLFKGGTYLKSLGYVNPMGFGSAVFGRVGLMALLGANLLLAVVCVRAIYGARVRRYGEERFVWWALVGIAPVYLLLPGTAFGVSDPGARVLQTGLALALVLCWRSVEVWEGRVAMGCSGMLAAAGIWLFVLYGGAPAVRIQHSVESETGWARFANVPNDDQDYFYRALGRGEMKLPVFPTGMFLNR